MSVETKLVVCPHCHKASRVPVDKLAAGGNCGAMSEAQISQWLQGEAG